jgi:hypothetical protein
MKTLPLLLLTGLLLSACASHDAPGQVGTAATTPLRDLNVVKAEIPETLQRAQVAPYALPAAADCAAIKAEIAQLDEVLGADLDAPPEQAERGLLERGGQEAGKALQRAAEGAVPFRGWVRKLSGAERYERRVAAAITAGGVRRAFLKGVRAARSC